MVKLFIWHKHIMKNAVLFVQELKSNEITLPSCKQTKIAKIHKKLSMKRRYFVRRERQVEIAKKS